jgi:hypothetical protein
MKRAALLGLLAALTLGNVSSSIAAGWGGLAAMLMMGHLSGPFGAGLWRGGSSYRAPYYPRHYPGFYPYQARHYGGYGAYTGYGGYGAYPGYGRYGAYGGGYGGCGCDYDDYGW